MKSIKFILVSLWIIGLLITGYGCSLLEQDETTVSVIAPESSQSSPSQAESIISSESIESGERLDIKEETGVSEIIPEHTEADSDPDGIEGSKISDTEEETSGSEVIPEHTEETPGETYYINTSITTFYNNHKNELLLSCFECLAWKEQRAIVVVISSTANIVDKSIVFSRSGQLLNQRGISAITVDDISSLLNLTETDLEAKYGKYHFDYGSGRYLPSYVTDNGSILILNIEDDVVATISEYRLTDGKEFYYGHSKYFPDPPYGWSNSEDDSSQPDGFQSD